MINYNHYNFTEETMKKVLAIIFVIAVLSVAVLGLTGCQNDENILKIGVTIFDPMNYQVDGEWTGFDTDFARAAAELMGYDGVEFVVINWDNKFIELKARNVDLIWNGMTINDEIKQNMDVSVPYMRNYQVAVFKKDKAEEYTSLEAIKDKKLTAEKGSAGEKAIKANTELSGTSYIASDSQAKVLVEVASGTSDVGFIDLTMASRSVGEGTSYSDLMFVDSAAMRINDEEQYGIGARKGDEIIDKLNAAIKQLYDDGTLKEIADKYGLGFALLEIK